MSDVDTPITIEIDEETLDKLSAGERFEIPLGTDGPMDDFLEVTWQTGPVESEGAAELHSELTNLFE